MRSLYFIPTNVIAAAATPALGTVTGGTTTLPTTSSSTLADTTAGNSTFNLPAAVSAGSKCEHEILKKVSDNSVLIVPNGTDTIAGVNATFPMAGDFSALKMKSDGVAGWWFAT